MRHRYDRDSRSTSRYSTSWVDWDAYWEARALHWRIWHAANRMGVDAFVILHHLMFQAPYPLAPKERQ